MYYILLFLESKMRLLPLGLALVLSPRSHCLPQPSATDLRRTDSHDIPIAANMNPDFILFSQNIRNQSIQA